MSCVAGSRKPHASVSFLEDVILPTRAEWYIYWQSSLTVSTQQATLYLHTECILLYLFIHFHVAKCCHFDELELGLANCFHSTGQVSHALNLNVLLVRVALPLLCFFEAHIRAAIVCRHQPPLSNFPGAFLIRVFLRNLRCSFQFHLARSHRFMSRGDYGPTRSSFSCEDVILLKWWGFLGTFANQPPTPPLNWIPVRYDKSVWTSLPEL